VKKVEMDNHFLPRVGMQCRYLLENGDTRIRSSSYAFHPERIEFSETDEGEKSIRHYILGRIDDNRSKISIDVYIEKTFLQPWLFTHGSSKFGGKSEIALSSGDEWNPQHHHRTR